MAWETGSISTNSLLSIVVALEHYGKEGIELVIFKIVM
jgi:hypothetical protein